MARERELVVVLCGGDAHRMRLEHALPEMRDLAGGAVPVAGRRDVHDRPFEQVDPRGGEAMRVRACQRVAAGEAGPDAQPVGRATIARFTEPTSVTSAPAPMCGSRL